MATVTTLDIEFMERCIKHRIDSCRLLDFEVDTGFGVQSLATEVVRLELTHDHSDCGPASIVVKLPKANAPYVRQGFYRREALLYEDLFADEDLPVPEFYAAIPGDDPNDITIALEDLNDAHGLSQTDAFSVEEADQVLRALAQVHTRFWHDPCVPDLYLPPELVQRWESNVEHGWTPFLDRYGVRLDSTRDSFEWLRGKMTTMVEHRAGSPATLLHGDFHPENVLLASDPDRPVVIIDWQTAGSGFGVHDLAIFFTASLTVEDRRTHQDALLRNYHRILTESGTVDLPFDEMFLQFRAATTFAMTKILMKIGGFGGQLVRDDALEVADVVFERTLAAVQDLDPVDAMKEVMARGS
jgi:hypothetical protein